MYCAKCGNELITDKCENCGYISTNGGKAADYQDALQRFNKDKKRAKIFYVILIVILVFRLLNYARVFVFYSNWDTVAVINGIILIPGVCLSVYLLFIIIKHWSLVFGSREITSRDGNTVLVFAILNILLTVISLILSILSILTSMNLDHIDQNIILILITSNAISFIIKAVSIAIYFLYFGSLRRMEKSQIEKVQ